MEIKAIAGDITRIETGAIILGIYEGVQRPDGELAAADEALGGAISQLINQSEIKGKLNEITLVHSLGRLPAGRVAVVGLGKQKDMKLDNVRGAIAEVCRFLRQKGINRAATIALGTGTTGIGSENSARAVSEGALLGLYSFRNHMTPEPDRTEFEELVIVSGKSDLETIKRGIHQGHVLSEATTLARDMVNEPANFMTPTAMADIAVKLARDQGLEVKVFDREQMKEMGMGALLGVAQGSQQPPRFIVLRYRGTGSDSVDLALIGKGITFDSGGISIKPAEGMGEMKGDMAGGAAVMAAISAIARLKLKTNAAAIVPATENMPDSNALKPGDILTAITGKTIEIISTDAEGRLILSDALGYAGKLKPGFMVDVATLTGACRVALGDICTGGFTNNQDFMNRVIAAGAEAGELIWQLPMYEQYKEQNKSDVADIKNSGGRFAGAITAAQFLAEFAGKIPWVHLDIAGTSMTDKERGYLVKGATGVPVRTLVNLALSMVK